MEVRAVRRRPARGLAARRARRRRDQGRAARGRRVPARDAGRAADLGRYFVPLNRGKRSVVLDLKTRSRAGRPCSVSSATADVVVHNYPPARAASFGLAWDALHARASCARRRCRHARSAAQGPLAGVPAYDLVAQARAGLLTAHASSGDRVPVRAGGIPIADLTAGFLLASGVLAALVRASTSGRGTARRGVAARRRARRADPGPRLAAG